MKDQEERGKVVVVHMLLWRRIHAWTRGMHPWRSREVRGSWTWHNHRRYGATIRPAPAHTHTHTQMGEEGTTSSPSPRRNDHHDEDDDDVQTTRVSPRRRPSIVAR